MTTATKLRTIDAIVAARNQKRELAVQLNPYGVSVSVALILDALSRSPEPLCMSEISQNIGLSPSSMTSLVDRLVGRGLVLREYDTEDRRRIWLMLTDAGRELAIQAADVLEGTEG